jgi:hypothetical protein
MIEERKFVDLPVRWNARLGQAPSPHIYSFRLCESLKQHLNLAIPHFLSVKKMIE